MISFWIVEKAHLTFLTPLLGVVSPFLGNRSSIVDRMVKPLFFASHKEICSEAFLTISLDTRILESLITCFYGKLLVGAKAEITLQPQPEKNPDIPAADQREPKRRGTHFRGPIDPGYWNLSYF